MTSLSPSAVVRPVPVPTQETRPFWQACAAGQLLVPRCAACAVHLLPPPPRCPHCLSASLEWVALSGRATLQRWTEVSLDVLPGVAPPFIVAEGELIEQKGLILVALLAHANPAQLRSGLPLRVEFVGTDEAQIGLPEFHVAEQQA